MNGWKVRRDDNNTETRRETMKTETYMIDEYELTVENDTILYVDSVDSADCNPKFMRYLEKELSQIQNRRDHETL